MNSTANIIEGAAHTGIDYDASSQTQHAQGLDLISRIPLLSDRPKVADIGCGNGKTTLDICEVLPSGATVSGSDLSATQIEVARQNLEAARRAGHSVPQDVTFYVADALQIGTTPETSDLDLIVSNAALHWVPDGRTMYGRLFDSLRPGGEILVQQGGKDCYVGLARVALNAANTIGIGEKFAGWQYPLFYPSETEMWDVLDDVGFVDKKVESLRTDGTQFPNLFENYANAGILPILEQAGDAAEELKAEYLKSAKVLKAQGLLDTFTHRLVISAQKPF